MRGLMGLCLMVLSCLAAANEADLKELIKKKLPNFIVHDINESNLGNGIYEVFNAKGQSFFTNGSLDGFMIGSLFGFDKNGEVVNVSEQRKEKSRALKAREIGNRTNNFEYKALGEEKAEIIVFTDIDCGYCRQFHNEVPSLNAMGITVKYFAFPRAGVESNSFGKLRNAWCNKNPLRALTDAKSGVQLNNEYCENNLDEQYTFGMTAGVTGTPAIMLENGRLLPGSRSAKEINNIIETNL